MCYYPITTDSCTLLVIVHVKVNGHSTPQLVPQSTLWCELDHSLPQLLPQTTLWCELDHSPPQLLPQTTLWCELDHSPPQLLPQTTLWCELDHSPPQLLPQTTLWCELDHVTCKKTWSTDIHVIVSGCSINHQADDTRWKVSQCCLFIVIHS